jgi:hypothetical protein
MSSPNWDCACAAPLQHCAVANAKIEHRAGKEAVLSADAPAGGYGVVFEDDGETGYFYGLDLTGAAPSIVDALHVYNVAAIPDRKNAPIEIRWAENRNRAGLFIGGECQAVFDFDDRRAVCRTGFPPGGDFTSTHEWDESLVSGL